MTLWAAVVVCFALNTNSICFAETSTSSGYRQPITKVQKSTTAALQNAFVLQLHLTISSQTSQASLELISSHYLSKDNATPFSVVFHPQLHQFSVKYNNYRRKHTETFYYDLKVDVINRVTLVLVEQQLRVYINCSFVYDRHIGAVNLGLLRTHTHLYGIRYLSSPIRSTRLVDHKLLVGFDERRWREQCYQTLGIDVLQSCSLATERTKVVKELQQELQSCSNNMSVALREKSSLVAELDKWQGCDCARPCWHNGRKRTNGSKWQKSYDETCACLNGNVQCRCTRVPKCWNSESLHKVKGHNCPRCFRKCNARGSQHKHSSWLSVSSTMYCQCLNGIWTNCKLREPAPPPSQTIVCDSCLNRSDCYRDGYYNCRCQRGSYVEITCRKACDEGSLIHPLTGKCYRKKTVQIMYSAANHLTKLKRIE